ncbi:MAG: hypothetical protein KGL39_00100 [Patescibacteria group bacterium]|nr:hypothetical protein [Patescibacteria group bacterium]
MLIPLKTTAGDNVWINPDHVAWIASVTYQEKLAITVYLHYPVQVALTFFDPDRTLAQKISNGFTEPIFPSNGLRLINLTPPHGARCWHCGHVIGTSPKMSQAPYTSGYWAVCPNCKCPGDWWELPGYMTPKPTDYTQQKTRCKRCGHETDYSILVGSGGYWPTCPSCKYSGYLELPTGSK